MNDKVVAVVVTYNRLTTLKKALNAYDNQIVPFDAVIVVDNKSTDNTKEYLSEWKTQDSGYDKHVLFLSENLGGSGGFFEGQKYALNLGAEWIMVADDDAYPSLNLVQKFKIILSKNDCSLFGAICTTVKYPSGEITYQHRCKVVNNHFWLSESVSSKYDDYKKAKFEIDIFSYVGTFLNSTALKQLGLCNKDFFIYLDDTEHSFRIKRFGNIIVYPELEIIHEGGLENSSSKDNSILTWRAYYSVRNNVFVMKHYYGFFTSVWFYFKQTAHYLKLYYNNYACLKLYFSAFFDGYFSHLGKHKLYRPPFSIK